MARQSMEPIQFQQSMRPDNAKGMTSGRAGQVIPIDYIPLLRGDSAAGSFDVTVELAEMPRPLLNAVGLNVQAWFVPKIAHPQFSGSDDFMASYTGDVIKQAGAPDRTPPFFFDILTSANDRNLFLLSDFCKTLGIHTPRKNVQTDLVDAYNLIDNFRRRAHSSRLALSDYASEDLASALALKPAFWPAGPLKHIVPDYEAALINGTIDFDVLSGRLPVSGIGRVAASVADQGAATARDTQGANVYGRSGAISALRYRQSNSTGDPDIFAEMAGAAVGMSLSSIDAARRTQAFANIRQSYAGTDTTGFTQEDAIIATLMSGYEVPADQFKRPWLVDSQRVMFGMGERHATDAANLTESVSQGIASARLSLNIPKNDSGGVLMIILEVVPDRIHERLEDPWLHVENPSDLPDALRDVQRPEPVDLVLNERIDMRHTDPVSLYGYEPMNMAWVRDRTVMGGDFYQADPTASFQEQRSAVWHANIVDPQYSDTHFLCPPYFPHDVFADTEAPAFEVSFRHSVAIKGLTQIGDPLEEANDNYAETFAHSPSDGTFVA